MKASLFAIVPMLLLGASAKHPPVHGPKPPIDACCCCDISINAISCDSAIPASDCICAAVVCPIGAPTIWHGAPPTPRPTSSDAPTKEFYPVPGEPTA